MKKSKSTATIRELSQQFGMSRDTVARALEPLPFKLGPNRAHLFDREKAERLLVSSSQTSAEMKRLRLEKLQSEAQLAKQKVDRYNRNHVTVSDSLFILDTFNKAYWSATRSSGYLSYPQELDLECRVERAVIAAMRDCGFPEKETEERERANIAREKQLQEDIKAGRVPENWAETIRPENDRRVWSQELGRYYTKKEIIAKFGPGAQISPIDEILDEVAEGAACG